MSWAGRLYLSLEAQAQLRISFPRVCGDVSITLPQRVLRRLLSPRMRGCF